MSTATAERSADLDLPIGFAIRLRPDVRRAVGGAVLVGGSPARVVRLTLRARELLAGDRLTVDGPATAGLARRLLDGNLADPDLRGLDPEAPMLTVVVPVRDRTDELDRCLTALSPLEVVVVDDGSVDPALVARTAARHGATVVHLPTNLGPAAARNVGLARVRTDAVAFVDSDVTVDAVTLLGLARHCVDPRVALVAPRVVGRSTSAKPHWFERYDAVASSLDLGADCGQVRAGARIGWLPSACLVGRVAHLGDGFDAQLRVGEDVDLVWRLVDAGLVVRYAPDFRAHHDTRLTARAWWSRKYVYGTGGADLALRHGDKVAPAVLSGGMALAAFAILARHRIAVPLAALVVTRTARSLRRSLPLEEGATPVALSLAARGLGWAIRQETGLLLRHWWPAAALAAPFSRCVRRALVSALVLDLVLFLRERPTIDPLTAVTARRIDDLAYGTGLWSGALRRRSLRCLAVRQPRESGRRHSPRVQ